MVSQPSPQPAIALGVGDVIVPVAVFIGALVSNVMGWLATRTVASAERRIDQNSLLLSELQKQQYSLERKIAEQYVNRDEFTHRITVLDTHIEKLGERVNEQTVILKSMEAAFKERFTQ
jgi:hypothetical protein